VYLYDTVQSIVNQTKPEERQDVTVIILLADFDIEYNKKVATHLRSRHKSHIDSGFIQIVHMNSSRYPDLDHIKQTFGDPPERLKWRAKQNIDFSFLMYYSENISHYYLQMEDDVLFASNYFSYIKTFVNRHTIPWFVIEFSNLGFIGKLFRSSDLKYVYNSLYTRYQEAPCDLLLGSMRKEKKQTRAIHSKESLFQHIGRFSSLKNKLMPSMDNSFKDELKYDLWDYPPADQPSANILSTFRSYDNYNESLAYDNDLATFLWARTPIKESTLTIHFHQPQNITRIVVVSGNTKKRKDKIQNTDLEFARANLKEAGVSVCEHFITLVKLVDGDADTFATGTAIPKNIKCLRLRVQKNMKTWAIIRDILVYL